MARYEVDVVDPGPVESQHFGHVRVVVTSFGFLHGSAPEEAHIVVDVREALRNPHDNPALRELTGLDFQIREHVLSTPRALDIVLDTAALVTSLLPGHDRRALLVQVAFGCAGGRHRSVVLANELTAVLLSAGIGTEVSHRDIRRPVVRHNPEVGA